MTIMLGHNRYVGMKSRGCYETPAGTVLFAAHQVGGNGSLKISLVHVV